MNGTRPTVVLAGALAQRAGVAGHAWVFVNWLIGLREAGFDVLFLDRLEPPMMDHPDAPVARSRQLAWLQTAMATAGLEAGQYAVLYDGGRHCFGMSRAQLLERCRGAAVLLNVMGYAIDPEVVAATPKRVFVDIDPGFGQYWKALHQADVFIDHDVMTSVGLNLGNERCTVPDVGLNVVTTVPPVALSEWPDAGSPNGVKSHRARTVCTWRGPFDPIMDDKVRYGLRVHEMRRFTSLPRALPRVTMELALAIDHTDAHDIESLIDGGWRLADPVQVASTLGDYRRYLRDSSLEFTIAKEMYVRSWSGWFSDRSASFLACGRPVIAQDTGFSEHLPVGEGLLAITDPANAVLAIEDVCGNWRLHSKAARELAVDLFDARKVMTSLLTRLGVG